MKLNREKLFMQSELLNLMSFIGLVNWKFFEAGIASNNIYWFFYICFEAIIWQPAPK